MFLLFFILLFASSAQAQTENYLAVAADRFAQEMANFKSSTEELSAGNAALTAQDKALKSRLFELQTQLQQLADENNKLMRTSLKLQEPNHSHSVKVVRLQKELYTLVDRLDHLAQEITASQIAIDTASKEDERLTGRLNELGGIQAAAAGIPDAPPTRAKEKLRLLKMIDESKRHQQDLYQQIAEAKKQNPIAVITVQSASEKEALLNQIAVLEEQVGHLNTPAPPEPSQPAAWGEEQLNQLQEQIRVLQKNQDELEVLTTRMEQKAAKTPMTTDERNELNRLRISLADLNKETRVMKAQLHTLRKQMVDLDKRKTSLESTHK